MKGLDSTCIQDIESTTFEVMKKTRRHSRKSSTTKSLRPLPALLVMGVFGFLFRIWLLSYRFSVASDEVNYLKLGVSGYLNGISDIFHTYWSPFLPSIISFFCLFTDNYEFAGRFVSVFAGTLLILPVYQLATYVYDKRVALIAAAFVAVFPPLVFQSTKILTEPVYMFLVAVALYTGLKMMVRYSTGYAVVTGLLSGFLYLTHPKGFAFIPLLVLWILFAVVSKLFLIRPLRAVYLMISLFFGFIVVSAPYIFYLKQETGKFTLSAKVAANQQFEAYTADDGDPFRMVDPKTNTVPIDLIYHQGTFLNSGEGQSGDVVKVHIGGFIKKYAKNVYYMLKSEIPALLTTWPMLLLGIGLLGRPWENQQGKKIAFLLSFMLFFWFVVICSFHIIQRYLTPFWPVLAIWIAVGAARIYAWLPDYSPLQKLSTLLHLRVDRLALILLCSGFLVFSILPELSRIVSRNAEKTDYWEEPVEQKKAGIWLKNYDSGPKIIMSRNHAVDIYAGNYNIAESVTIPTCDIECVLRYAESRGVDYLVLNERYIKDYQMLRFLLAEDAGVAGLQLIYREEQAGLTTVIYKLGS
jgi:4-amino-4-deoxy-L-arabinose transferase-like glycosyltransferase